MKLHEFFSQIGITALLMLTKTFSVTEGMCPQQPVAESVVCRSAQWLRIRWRVVFEDSLALSDITKEYISSDPVGHTHEATGNGLSFSFNLTFNNQSQLVSIMTVTRYITNSTINITVHCGQDTHHLSWIAVQDPPVPASPEITNESIVGGDSHGITIMLEWTSSLSDASESVVDSYIINVFPPISSVSTFTTANTSIQLFILYNQDYNISVVATNCIGNSTPTETNVKIGYCVHNESNVTVTANNSGLAIICYCQLTVSGDNSSVEPIAAVCTTNGNWSTNPNKLECSSDTMPETSEASTSTRTSTSTSTDHTSPTPTHSVLLISTLLVIGLLLAVILIVFITAVLVVYNLKGITGDHDSNKNLSLSEGNGGEEQINEGIMLEEQGIYSLLQAESENKLNDSEKKEAHGQLIYADIGNLVVQHTASISATPYPSLSLQLDDSQVQYADINPHQSTTNHNNNIIMVVEAEAGTASPTASFLSNDSLNLDTLLIQLRSEVSLKWREFGLAVGLAEDLLDKYSTYPPEECIVEVLDVWLRNYNCGNTDASMIRKPTWRDVARALREIELHQLANSILSLCKDGECESDIMDAVSKQRNYIPLADDELPPPLPPKVINFDEEMEPLPQQEELGTPPPLPPPYNETSLKQMFCSSAPSIPPKNNLQT